MPPTSPPMNGRAFQIASLTVSPNPSRVDFCTTTSACDWNALTSIAPTLLKLLRMWTSRSPAAWGAAAPPAGVGDALVEVAPALGVVGGHRAAKRELRAGPPLLDQAVGVDD